MRGDARLLAGRNSFGSGEKGDGRRRRPRREARMSVLAWLAATWLALLVLGWSWLVAAARADRRAARHPRGPPRRPPPRPRGPSGVYTLPPRPPHHLLLLRAR